MARNRRYRASRNVQPKGAGPTSSRSQTGKRRASGLDVFVGFHSELESSSNDCLMHTQVAEGADVGDQG